jgi:hypothetical protein
MGRMTRADLFVNFAFAVTLLAPWVAWFSFRLRREVHRRVQVALVCVAWLAVLVLEARIRLEGGSGSFISHAPADCLAWARALLRVHIIGAISSYALWTVLAVLSWRRYRQQLPGAFSRLHRRLGWLVFSGLCFDAATATGVYVLAFVA